MTFGNITLIGNLVTDIRTSTYNDSKGNPRNVASFTIAHQDAKFDENTKSWVNGPSVYTKISLFAGVADAFLASSGTLAKGTTLMISGQIYVAKDNAYVGTDGVQHPERYYDGIRAEHVAVVMTKGVHVSVTRNNSNNSAPQNNPQNNNSNVNTSQNTNVTPNADGFVNIPDGVDNALPFGNETTNAPTPNTPNNDDLFGGSDDLFGGDTGDLFS